MKSKEMMKEMESWVNRVKEKGTAAVEIARLKLTRSGLEKKVSRLHTRLGERVEYLVDLGKDKIEEDEVVKGFLQEIKDLREEMKEIEAKVEALRKVEPEAKGQAQGEEDQAQAQEEPPQEKQEN